MTTLTIPGTVAYHVVGETSVELAQGDLTVIASASNSHAIPKSPVLVLTVAQAAFQIYEDTIFGTVEGDDRVYVFKPNLGEGVSGYVKLVLPEGVSEAGSEFNALQERFEKILINRGLLSEGESPPTQGSVTIPSATASHVLGETTIELAKGNLVLSTVAPSQSKDPKSVLLLSIGASTFQLRPTTTFGTVADNELVYIFKPEIHDGDLPTGGYIRITLPDREQGLTDQLQEKFEQLLIDHGLLKTGVLAAGDEISRSVDEDTTSAADSIRSSTAAFLSKNPPTDAPLTYSDTAHTLSASSSSATTTLYNAAQTVSSSISSAAASAGAFLSTRLAGGPPAEETKEAARAAGDVYNSVREGTKVVKDAITTSVGDIVQNEMGKETRYIGGNVVGSVGDVGAAVGQVAEVGTGAVLVSGGVKGVVAASDPPDSSEEMATFAIEEKDEEGEWKDVSV